VTPEAFPVEIDVRKSTHYANFNKKWLKPPVYSKNAKKRRRREIFVGIKTKDFQAPSGATSQTGRTEYAAPTGLQWFCFRFYKDAAPDGAGDSGSRPQFATANNLILGNHYVAGLGSQFRVVRGEGKPRNTPTTQTRRRKGMDRIFRPAYRC